MTEDTDNKAEPQESLDEALAAAAQARSDWVARYLGEDWEESEPGIFISRVPSRLPSPNDG